MAQKDDCKQDWNFDDAQREEIQFYERQAYYKSVFCFPGKIKANPRHYAACEQVQVFDVLVLPLGYVSNHYQSNIDCNYYCNHWQDKYGVVQKQPRY